MGRRERQEIAWSLEHTAALPSPCALCEREVPELSEHHLIPRSQGRRRGLKADELPVVMLCGACHDFVHHAFSNAELGRGYETLEALREHEGVQRFLKWVKKQPVSKAIWSSYAARA